MEEDDVLQLVRIYPLTTFEKDDVLQLVRIYPLTTFEKKEKLSDLLYRAFVR